jgi:phosphoribosylformimino-5-aminoimidazole carboxamide ribotide isomerase
MKIFPAIDLRDGKAVRLFQGDYDQMTVYSHDPADVALGFYKAGARNLHMVDLDGAKDGTLANFDVVANVARKTEMFVEIGGGIRDEERIKRYIDAGVGRVILGTVAAEKPEFAEAMAAKYGEKIAVGVDARDGRVAVKGWLEVTDIDSVEFCRKMRNAGVKTIIYTDISKDGAMSGTNIEIYRRLNEIEGLDIMASGGVSTLDDVRALADMKLYGAILGKALYTGAIDLAEAVKIVKGAEEK